VVKEFLLSFITNEWKNASYSDKIPELLIYGKIGVEKIWAFHRLLSLSVSQSDEEAGRTFSRRQDTGYLHKNVHCWGSVSRENQVAIYYRTMEACSKVISAVV
jgi:hypothetical protein